MEMNGNGLGKEEDSRGLRVGLETLTPVCLQLILHHPSLSIWHL